MKQQINRKLYCRGCGKELEKSGMPAEEYTFSSPAGDIQPLSHSAYNKETGRRQWVYRYTCHYFKNNWKTKIFGSEHTDWVDETLYEEISFGKWEKVK